jgi:C4-dicarboxylate-specific signal transduction histidine kinase
LAEPRHTPLSFRPAARVARDEEFDESVFDRAARAPAPTTEPFEDELETEEADESRSPREGLPSSYRMRHDPHYVDQIAARARPAIPVSVFAELTEHLGAIDACLHLFSDRERPLRERVAMGLVHAEVQRAAWLSQALAVLAGDPPVLSNTIEIEPLVRRLASAFGPERELSGVECDCECGDGIPPVRGDEQLLGIALAGMMAAIHAVVERVPCARVRLEVSGFRGEIRVSVSQDLVSLPPASRTRFFDLAWTERPGGVGIGARLAATRRVAELHGGKVQLNATERGCALTLALPITRD